MDTKVRPGEEKRCKLTIRNCYFHGWQQPGQVDNLAALNLKEHIDATVTNCVFGDNEIAFRVRGPGAKGGAKVTIEGCVIESGNVGVRMEDKVEGLTIRGMRWGEGVKEKYVKAGGGAGPDLVVEE